MITQQRAQRRTLPDRIALKIITLPKPGKLAVRRTDLRTLEIIQIEIRQQMQSRLNFVNFDRRAAIVGDERFGPRHHQQIERIVIRPAFPRRELRRLARSPPPQSIEAQQPARSRIRIPAILRPPIQQPRDNPVLANPKPGPAGFKILPANNMRMLQQGSGVACRPLEKLIAMGRNHDGTILGSPKINRQRAHPIKIDSPPAPRTTPLGYLARYFTGEEAGRNADGR